MSIMNKIKNWKDKLVCSFFGHKPVSKWDFPVLIVYCSRCNKTVESKHTIKEKKNPQKVKKSEMKENLKVVKPVLIKVEDDMELEPLALSKNERNPPVNTNDLIDYCCGYVDEDTAIDDEMSLEECIDHNLHGRESMNGYCMNCGELSTENALSLSDAMDDFAFTLITLEECTKHNLHNACVDEDGYCVHCGSRDA